MPCNKFTLSTRKFGGMAMKHINCLMNPTQYNNLWTLLHEAHDRAEDSILTCKLETEQIEELMEALE